MVWKPHVTVAAIIEENDHFLVVEEYIDGQLLINQPAGHLDEGEGLIKAVSREALEETGRYFTPTALVGTYRWVSPSNRITYLRFAFAGTHSPQDFDYQIDPVIHQVRWMSLTELRQRHQQLRSPLVIRCIEDYLAGHRCPLEFIVDS